MFSGYWRSSGRLIPTALSICAASHHITTSTIATGGSEARAYAHSRQGSEEDIADLKRLNPRAKIPALQDGALVLAESAAILIYLADHYGGGELVPLPKTSERATHDMWMFYRALRTLYHSFRSALVCWSPWVTE